MKFLDRLKTRFPHVMMAPQARFLDFLHRHARHYPHFTLAFHACAQGLIEEDGTVKGVRYKDEHDAVREIRAPLTVAADGRASRIARMVGFEADRRAAEIEVIWLRPPRKDGDASDEGALYCSEGRFMVVLERQDERGQKWSDSSLERGG